MPPSKEFISHEAKVRTLGPLSGAYHAAVLEALSSLFSRIEGFGAKGSGFRVQDRGFKVLD